MQLVAEVEGRQKEVREGEGGGERVTGAREAEGGDGG